MTITWQSLAFTPHIIGLEIACAMSDLGVSEAEGKEQEIWKIVSSKLRIAGKPMTELSDGAQKAIEIHFREVIDGFKISIS